MLTLMFVGLFLGESPFVKGSVNEVLAKARKENKLVFVDVYTTWCGPCKLMDRNTFSNKEVAAFLRDKVVSFKIDAEKGEGIGFARKYRVMGYPCFLVLDGDGKLVARQMGYMVPRAFLKWVRSVVS